MLCCFFCQIVGGLFFFGCTIRVVVVFSTVVFIFSFLLLFVCFFSCFFLRFSKSAAPQFFYGCFSYFFSCFLWGGDFHGDFFCCFFSFSLAIWRFLLSLPYMALYGLSSMCYICKTSNIWGQCTVVGTFLILKAINYFLCFCFLFSFGSVRGGRSRWTRAVHVMVDLKNIL